MGNSKEYNHNYYLENKEKYNKPWLCKFCDVECKMINRAKHLKSNKHQMMQKINELQSLGEKN
jgi:hypothetical protein